MKKTFILAMILIAFTNLFAQERGVKPIAVEIEGEETKLYDESHALVIGNINYTSAWNKLPGVERDVTAVVTALEKNGFNVVVKTDLTKNEIDKVFSDFIAKYGKAENNRLLFYYAGHGNTVKSKYGDDLGYIVPIDAPNPNIDEAGFQAKALEMAQIEIYAKRIDSKHALFLFDACFAGSLFALRDAVPGVINYKTKLPVRQFITSGSADETVPDESIFRKQFVTALTSNNADANKDGYLTGTELGKFLQDNVINYSYENQHPQYGKIRHSALDKGDFVFIINKKTSTIILETELSGKLYINNEFKQDIYADNIYTLIDIKAGIKVIRIEGDENWERNVSINQNETINIKAKKKTVNGKQISISSNPPNAELYINGKMVGKTPYNIFLNFGTYELDLSKTGYNNLSQDLTIEKGKLDYNFSLIAQQNMEYKKRYTKYKKKTTFNSVVMVGFAGAALGTWLTANKLYNNDYQNATNEQDATDLHKKINNRDILAVCIGVVSVSMTIPIVISNKKRKEAKSKMNQY